MQLSPNKEYHLSYFRPLMVLLAFFPPYATADMQEEIDHLLSFIAGSDCIFQRNGEAHTGSQAIPHIKKKYDYYQEKIRSTEDFIAFSATKSVLSGKPYTVQCGNNLESSQAWLLTELKIWRESHE